MKYTSIDHGSNSPLGNRVSSSQSNARSTTSSLTTRLAQWLVILALSLYLVLTQHSSRGTALTPVAPPPLRTADLEQSVEDPKYIIREPPGYLIGPPQVYLNATGLAYNLTIHETRLQNEQAQTQAVDGGPSYGLHIKSTLRVLKGPALATGGATDLEAVCLFREEYAKSGSRKGVRHYTPKGKIVPRGTRHSQDLGYTDIDVDIVCPVPAAFEKQLDRLGDVLLKFRYNIGKLLTDTVKGEELDSTVVFSANPIRLRIQS